MHSVASRYVPTRFADRTFDTFVQATDSQSEAFSAARSLVMGTYRSLVLVGPPGVGKSHLAAAVVNAIMDQENARYLASIERSEDRHPRVPTAPMWANVADLIVNLRMQMDAPLDDRDATAMVRSLRKHPALVVLDDLGREKVSDWTGELVYALVNARYENRLPTLVTSNLSPAELAASPYWPAVSRLAEDGALVKITAPDRRLA